MLRKSCENLQKAKTPKQPQNKKKMQKEWKEKNRNKIYLYLVHGQCLHNL